MSKIRIYDLAKELDVAAKQLVENLRKKGLIARQATASSSIEQRDADAIRRACRDAKPAAKAAPPEKAKAKAAPPAKPAAPAKPAPADDESLVARAAHESLAAKRVLVVRKKAPEPEPAAAPLPEKKIVQAEPSSPKTASTASAELARHEAPVFVRRPAPSEEADEPALTEKAAAPVVRAEEFSAPLPEESVPLNRPIIVVKPEPPAPRVEPRRQDQRRPMPPRRQPPKPGPAGGPPRPGGPRPGAKPHAAQAAPGAAKVKTEKGPVVRPEPQPAPIPRYEGEPRLLYVPEGVTVKELSERMNVKGKDVLAELLRRGVFAHINQTLDDKTVESVSEVFGYLAEVLPFEDLMAREQNKAAGEKAEAAGKPEPKGDVPRAPIVTVMGHVDHGKTKLLDAIRKTNVALQEAGGITQHIGAYHVTTRNPKDGTERSVVFLDTPGHEAFTRMRARGASVTDVVVLVVAADDGVMPQTREAHSHAKAAGVPIVVAINKIDKPGANLQKVKTQLAEMGLLAEDWGGDTVMVEVSALKGQGIDELLEMLALVSDLRELRCRPNAPATGTVIEAHVDKGHGQVANVLVQDGTLRVGDAFIAGQAFGRVRAIISDAGQFIQEAGPATPVEILGLNGLPGAGDRFQVVEDEKDARRVATMRVERERQARLRGGAPLTLSGLANRIESGNIQELPIILKCDVSGSLEVLSENLRKLGTEKLKIKLIHSALGAITEGDVLLASSTGAIILGFHVRPQAAASDLAEAEGVEIQTFDVIYELTQAVEDSLRGLLKPVRKEVALGRAEVREVFRIKGVGAIAGCYVSSGSVTRKADVKLLRNNVVVYEGRVSSLKRFKDDASEVKQGFECGIGIENFNDIKPGDSIEAYREEWIKPESLK